MPFDPDGWTVDPLGERDGETIYGRGATDMKGTVAAMVEAARCWAASDDDPPVPVGFAFVSDEEVSGDDTGLAALELFDSQPTACVIGEQTGTVDRPSLTVADKGAIWLRLAATGTAAHGSRPTLGENALDRAFVDGLERADPESEWVDGMTEPWLREDGKRAFARAAVSTNTNHTTEIDYGAIDVDLLCLWGAKDAEQPVEDGHRLTKDIGGKVVELDDAGHWVPEDRPKAYRDHLKAFLAGT